MGKLMTLRKMYYERHPDAKRRAKRLANARYKKRHNIQPKNKGKRKNRPKKAKFEKALFRAFDGEGKEIDGIPQYLLLASSDGDYVFNPKGLDTITCFEFLLSKANKKYVNVMFVGTYDVNMILRDVPKHKILSIWDNESFKGTLVFGKYWVKYIPRKLFRISDGERTITIWDIFGYFQTSFVKTIESWIPEYPHLQTIIEGKEKRGTSLFDSGLEYVLNYTKLELDAMVHLMNKLRDYLKQANITITRYDGAGSIASALLKKHYEPLPLDKHITNLAYNAYYGGRIETYGVGTLNGPLYQYDIRSAYPSIMVDLPKLSGKWHRSKKIHPTNIGLYKVYWETDDNICPFPVRDKNGSLLYPQSGVTWVWCYELWEALKQKSVYVQVKDGWIFESDSDEKAFAWVRDLYEQRKEWKKQGIKAEMVLKLGINSLYGKMAQTVGYNPITGKIPPFHNPIYAGLITSGTRAKLYSAMMQNPNGIAYCATDGIVSTKPLDLPISENLGDFEETVIQGLKVVQSGVYCWKIGDTWKYHYRGLDGGLFTLELLDKAWKEFKDEIPLTHTRFIGMGAALASKDFYSVWRKFVKFNKTLVINGHAEFKRNYWENEQIDLSEKWVQNSPLESAEESRPYIPIWANSNTERQSIIEKLTDKETVEVWVEELESDYL